MDFRACTYTKPTKYDACTPADVGRALKASLQSYLTLAYFLDLKYSIFAHVGGRLNIALAPTREALNQMRTGWTPANSNCVLRTQRAFDERLDSAFIMRKVKGPPIPYRVGLLPGSDPLSRLSGYEMLPTGCHGGSKISSGL